MEKPIRRPRKKMELKVDLQVEYVPLPPEREEAWYAAWRLLFELAERAEREEQAKRLSSSDAQSDEPELSTDRLRDMFE